MIGISKLYMGQAEASDPLRYGRRSADLPSHLLQFSKDKKPIVVWNITQRCNLKCKHCYAAGVADVSQELTHEEALRAIDGFAAFGCPVLLFSGGEPFIREDILDLAAYARQKGLRVVFSTNGTCITAPIAQRIAEIGVSYVGISIDGVRETHDAFRGVPGAYDRSLAAIRLCREAGVKVGLRVTLTRANAREIPAIFSLMREERIPRICLYHLVYTGRGAEIQADDLTHEESRQTVDCIIDETRQSFEMGHPLEVLTVDNHCDAPYLWMRMVREGAANTDDVLRLLRMNGGNSSGHGLSCVSWDGTVYPDQFWRNKPLGNVKTQSFGEIWGAPQPGSLLDQLRHKPDYVTGRCQTCRFLPLCGGNFRARAEAATGELWGEDPACYLTDDEIAGALPDIWTP
ncbi:MAG: radical SAM protein [Kiritimatiellae bacterium]|nr:radical SAM protein [Kiritimatiellia bacterium]